MTLSAKQRHALAVIAATDPEGAMQTLLNAHGFGLRMITGLVNRGLATLTHENMRTGGKLVEIVKVRITDDGRAALADEG